MKAIFKIKRFNPVTKRSYYQTYRLELEKGDNVLTALSKIHGQLDGSLAFRHSCRSGSCGSCSMVINNVSRLACETRVGDLIKDKKTITLEPMNNMHVIKDLIVDYKPFWDRIDKITPWLATTSKGVSSKREHISEIRVAELRDSLNCIYCCACYSGCPALARSRFLGPTSLLKIFRFINDPRDAVMNERFKILSNDIEKIVLCTQCSHCNDVCPKEINIRSYIRKTIWNMVDSTKISSSLGFEYLKQKSALNKK